MTTAYTSLLGLALPVTGELSGTWGDTVNNAITSLLDSAVAGTTTVSTDADVTLTTTTGAANQAREAILLFSGSRTAIRNVTAPAQSKIYTVINATTGGYSVVLRATGPTTGVTIVAGESALCAWNGSDFIKVSNFGGPFTVTDLTVTGNTILGDANTDTVTINALSRHNALSTFGYAGATGSTLTTSSPAFVYSGATTYTDTSISGGTKAHGPFWSLDTPTLTNATTATTYTNASTLYIAGAPTAGTNITITNPYALYINAGNVYLGGGTANGVAYLNGSKVLTTGSALVFDGTNLGAGGSPTAYSGYGPTIGTKGGNGGIFQSQNNAGTANALFYIDGNVGAAFLNTLTNHPWAFKVNDAEQMRLTSTGLGIGTSSPSAKLTLSGNQSFVEKTAAYLGVDVATSSGNGGNFTVKAGAGSGAGNAAGSLYLGAGRGNASSSNGAIYFGISQSTNAVGLADTLMTLDGSGNLGLGVTPSAYISAYRALEIGTTTGLYGRTDSTMEFALALNCYRNSGGSWIYRNNGVAARYNQNLGAHWWDSALSGTAGNTITFTQTMTLDASGNLGIGTTSPSGKLDVIATNAGGTTYNYFQNNGASGTSLVGLAFAQSGSIKSSITAAVYGNDYMTFNVGSNTERARIDSSGNFLIGGITSTILSAKQTLAYLTGSNGLTISTADNISGTDFAIFRANGATCGTVTRVGTTSAVNYVAASDYRLKNVIGAVTGHGERIDALKPIHYSWKDGGQSASGFLAHEFQEIYANSVTGSKDAVDADGNPKYQAMQASTSEVIADLVAEIQSLRKRLAALESK